MNSMHEMILSTVNFMKAIQSKILFSNSVMKYCNLIYSVHGTDQGKSK